MSYKWLYVGAWSLIGRDAGIGIFRLNDETGETEFIKTVFEDVVAGTMLLDTEKCRLYVCDERSTNPDFAPGGRVFAFSVNPGNGELTELNRMSSFGTLPAYVSFDGTGRGIVICNHSSGTSVPKIVRDTSGNYRLTEVFADTTIVHYPLDENGALLPPDDIVITEPEKGFYSCVHSANLAPDGKSIICCDRNMDRVYSMSYCKERSKLVVDCALNLVHGDNIKSGDCPRYSVFHPTLPTVYINSEYSPLIFALDYSGKLTLKGRFNIEPPEFAGAKMSPSDMAVSADGKMLYILLRYVSAVGAYSIDENGKINFVSCLKLSGSGPRGCRLSKNGKFLLVCNLDSAELTTIKLDGKGGMEEVCSTSGQKNPGNTVIFE